MTKSVKIAGLSAFVIIAGKLFFNSLFPSGSLGELSAVSLVLRTFVFISLMLAGFFGLDAAMSLFIEKPKQEPKSSR